MKPIYLDYAASAPLRPEVKQAINRVAKIFGNPNSSHTSGREALNLADAARRQVAEMLNCQPSEIIFTGSATEADNLAIKGVALNRGRGHIITTAIEHKAVLESCRWLETQGFTVSYIKPGREGLISAAKIGAAIRPDTILVSVMYANNEIGTIQPIRAIGKLIETLNRERTHPILFHTDAVQAGNYLNLDTKYLHVDLLTLSGHKLGGPKGIGCLFARGGVTIAPQMHGGGQERGLRSGTVNVTGAVSMAAALAAAQKNKAKMYSRHHEWQRDLANHLQQLPGVEINHPLDASLPNIVNVSVRGHTSDTLVIGLDRMGIAVSAASACAAGGIEPSYVLQALHLPQTRATSSLRISWGWQTKKSDLTALVKVMKKLV
ncbi:MAG: class V aminotransferase, cysteine desulfurase [candidate division Kazan bacterium GW2011_GWA1_50_15]|uniref:cysteine desulfurase n=2 Tax=Bacteria division Kazan-3B-28 TaxID=1798534 RepID=A0A0G1X7M0_UNCK3|nr:MAG: class V aminotransferase, cysteine desulfurase [candidate division Kazan bacterium GW2011_GWA1_50_15]KKW25818.1 MAG: Cysteine desulfurase family protein [candidate division Kazan bacterium GW2011_GWC1_52_13]KKW27168.1 MAG: Cysteine desulfurase family protein [candidate division Kazan bacterium GW2011_GWB1_52_7]HCR42456.1 cysteine desulfurase NifS [Patescibacteria group bacterium]